MDYAGLSDQHERVTTHQPHHHQQGGNVESVTAAPMLAWVAVVLMVIGFGLCTLGFIIHNNLILWISGGVVGAIGVIVAISGDLMGQAE